MRRHASGGLAGRVGPAQKNLHPPMQEVVEPGCGVSGFKFVYWALAKTPSVAPASPSTNSRHSLFGFANTSVNVVANAESGVTVELVVTVAGGAPTMVEPSGVPGLKSRAGADPAVADRLPRLSDIRYGICWPCQPRPLPPPSAVQAGVSKWLGLHQGRGRLSQCDHL
jgi:hypothetical protein